MYVSKVQTQMKYFVFMGPCIVNQCQ